MKKIFYAILFFLASSQSLLAQIENEPCSADCLPNTGIITGTLPNQDGFSPNVNVPCGFNTTEDNPTWYTFVALGSTFTVDVVATNCTGASGSLQATFFEGNDCDNVSAIGCLNCVTDGQLSIATVPGKQYWLQMDGCAEAICDFKLTYSQVGSLNITPVPVIIGDLVAVLNVTEQVYEVKKPTGIIGVSSWDWTINPPAIKKEQNDIDGTVTYKFTSTGKYTICVKPILKPSQCPFKTIQSGCVDIGVQKTDNFVRGEVFLDKNTDCKRQPNEQGLPNRIVEINTNKYTKTDSTGYFLALAPAQYTFSTKARNFYESVCSPITTDLKDSAVVDIPLKVSAYCPYLNVDISANILRPCMNNIYFVSYCNNGSAVAKNAYVTVELDPNMNYKSSSIPLTKQVGNLLTFDIADVKVAECGNFNITTFLACDVLNNATHCVEVHIYPDSICLPVPNNYGGAKVEVKATCGVDEVILTVKNTGKNKMASQRKYRIVEDEVVYEKGTFQLAAKDSLVIKMPKNGKMYRIEAEQEENYPYLKSNPSAWVEACTDKNQQLISLGMVNKYSKDDDDPFTAIYCRQNVTSYDPNEKIAFPEGFQDNKHYIEQNTSIEYELHFQNEGKDTAFLVVLKDQLDIDLDINSIEVGASSHPYRWDISQTGVLSFTFEKIKLTTKKEDEAKSQGHVKFRIAQKPNLPLGTPIYNRGDIYFDFNPPIFTNTTYHTIGKDFIKTTNTVAVKNADYQQVRLKVYPNPFEDKITFELEEFENKDNEKLSLYLFSIEGKLIEKTIFHDNQVQLLRNNLPKGLYFYQIKMGNKNIQNGKVVAE